MIALEEVLDRDAAVATALGDPNLFAQLVGLFVGYYPDLLDDIRDAIAAGDCECVTASVHRLKGAIGTFHAREALQTARQLETIAKESRMDDAMPTFRQLAEQVLTLVAALERTMQELKVAHV